MEILATATETVHNSIPTGEALIIISNFALVLVTLALVVTTTMDNHNMAKIAMILARKVVRRGRTAREAGYKPRHGR